jgi:hypothetical protein
MKLRFHSRAGHLVALPGGHRTGSIPRYIGRTYEPETRAFPATAEPLEVKPFKPGAAVSFEQRQRRDQFMGRLKKLCRRGELLPADEATAAHCQVPWAKPVRQDDGEWQVEGHVAGWCDWPKRHPKKLAEDVAKLGGKRAKAFAEAGGKSARPPKEPKDTGAAGEVNRG